MEINSKKVKPKDILTNSQRLPETRDRLPINWVTALFAKFQVRYGHKWISQIDGVEELAVNEWAERLGGLSGEQIKFGLDNWDGDWPPSADEFKKACLNKKTNGFGLDYIPEYHRIKNPERLLESDEVKERRKAAHAKGMTALRDVIKK